MTLSYLINSGVSPSLIKIRVLSEEPDERLEGSDAHGSSESVAGDRRTQILLVEDDDRVAQALTGILVSRGGYDVSHARSGEAGLRAAYRRHPDLMLLDLGLPDRDGFDVLMRLRAVSDVPVICVTARADIRSRIHGLNLGADDYVVKPYDPHELLARMERVLQRHRAPKKWVEDLYDDGLLRLDSQSFDARIAGAPLKLTPTEFRLFDLLVRNAGMVQPFRKLLAHAWDDLVGRDTDKVKFVISRLRGKLDSTPVGSESIVSARGVGYLYQAPAVPKASGSGGSQKSGYGHAGNVLRILDQGNSSP